MADWHFQNGKNSVYNLRKDIYLENWNTKLRILEVHLYRSLEPKSGILFGN